MSRLEALRYRKQRLKFRARGGTGHLLDIAKETQTETESFHSMSDASLIAGQLVDVRISEKDQFLLESAN